MCSLNFFFLISNSCLVRREDCYAVFSTLLHDPDPQLTKAGANPTAVYGKRSISIHIVLQQNQTNEPTNRQKKTRNLTHAHTHTTTVAYFKTEKRQRRPA